jgi:hypothetical protein
VVLTVADSAAVAADSEEDLTAEVTIMAEVTITAGLIITDLITAAGADR